MFDGNRVTAHTRSRYPIFQSPMTWIARAPLVSAVSAAGGMGLLENSIRDLSVTQREFTAIRAATNQPFGVNLPVRYLQMDPKEESAIIDWLLGQGIHFVTTSAGDPTRYTRMLKDAGVTVYHATATLRGAIKAVAAGGNRAERQVAVEEGDPRPAFADIAAQGHVAADLRPAGKDGDRRTRIENE